MVFRACNICTYKPIFKYMGRITATKIGASRLYLEALAIFQNFLVFTNQDTLFVTNVDTFIETPAYISPVLFKKLHLNKLINSYSGGVYPKTISIAGLIILDHCLKYVTVFIHTRYYGTILIEVDKDAFYYDEWIDEATVENITHRGMDSFMCPQTLKLQVSKIQHGHSGIADAKFDKYTSHPHDTLKSINEDNDDLKSLQIISNGKLLQNIYSYDYKDSITVLNQKVMGILIKREIDSVYNYYILRIINLMTHGNSTVYKDYYINDVYE